MSGCVQHARTSSSRSPRVWRTRRIFWMQIMTEKVLSCMLAKMMEHSMKALMESKWHQVKYRELLGTWTTDEILLTVMKWNREGQVPKTIQRTMHKGKMPKDESPYSWRPTKLAMSETTFRTSRRTTKLRGPSPMSEVSSQLTSRSQAPNRDSKNSLYTTSGTLFLRSWNSTTSTRTSGGRSSSNLFKLQWTVSGLAQDFSRIPWILTIS